MKGRDIPPLIALTVIGGVLIWLNAFKSPDTPLPEGLSPNQPAPIISTTGTENARDLVSVIRDVYPHRCAGVRIDSKWADCIEETKGYAKVLACIEATAANPVSLRQPGIQPVAAAARRRKG